METIQSDILHLNKFIAGVESLKENHHASVSDLSNVERYTIGVMKADGIKFDIHSGNEGFIADAGKKIWEVIKRIFARIAQTCKTIKEKIKGLFTNKNIEDKVNIEDVRNKLKQYKEHEPDRVERYKKAMSSLLKKHFDMEDEPTSPVAMKRLKEILDENTVYLIMECASEYKETTLNEIEKLVLEFTRFAEHLEDKLRDIVKKVSGIFDVDDVPLVVTDIARFLQLTVLSLKEKAEIYSCVIDIDDLENKK